MEQKGLVGYKRLYFSYWSSRNRRILNFILNITHLVHMYSIAIQIKSTRVAG